jgi:hypothetical protein
MGYSLFLLFFPIFQIMPHIDEGQKLKLESNNTGVQVMQPSWGLPSTAILQRVGEI